MHSHFDRDTFQQFLANAFAVQRSQINRQLLSDIMEIQRSVAKGSLDLDGAMSHVVESAKNVANASGVAIGLLTGTQLIYRSASGASVAYIGQHVTASLTVSAATRTSREILRVENAQTDTRIEADICRQFGANALLILPIYHNGSVAGVLDIRFSEPHAFEDLEVRTYRLLTEQIEAAMFQAAQLQEKNNLAPELAPPANLHEFTDPVEAEEDLYAPRFWMGESSVPSFFERCQTSLTEVRELPAFKHSAVFVTGMMQRAKRLTGGGFLPLRKFSTPSLFRPRNGASAATREWRARKQSSVFASTSIMMHRMKDLSDSRRLGAVALASVAVMLAFAAWTAYRGHGAAAPFESSTLPKSTDVDSPAVLPKPLPSKALVQTEIAPGKEARPSRTVAKQRVRAGDNGVYNIGDDVTVRVFTPRPAVQRSRAPKSRVAHIGNDVTVRYFTPTEPAPKPVSR